MNAIEQLIGRLAGKATSVASDAAATQAAAQYERFKPLIFAAVFMAVTTFVFYFLPRFRLPWRRVD